MIARSPGWSLAASPEQLLEAIGAGRTQRRRAQRAAAEVLRAKWITRTSGRGKGRVYEAGIYFFTFGGRVIARRENSGVQRRSKVTEAGLPPGATPRRGRHQASAPGDAPARDTGALASAIHVDDSNPDELRVGGDRKLLRLEFGVGVPESKVAPHPGGIVIRPRPSAKQALEDAKEQMTRVLVRELRP